MLNFRELIRRSVKPNQKKKRDEFDHENLKK